MTPQTLHVIAYGGPALAALIMIGVIVWDANGKKVSAFTYIMFWILLIGGTWMGVQAFKPPF